MSATHAATRLMPRDTDQVDIVHVRCCDPFKAMCGADIDPDECRPLGPSEEDCVVCADLEWSICPRCGT